jgi:hypothetical protein
MPSFDQCHDQVKRALQKDGWRIVEEQFPMVLGNRRAFIDLRGTRAINGSRLQMMLLEVKCFPDSQNTNHELYTAVGQYILYRAMLNELDVNVPLYLSIPESVFDAVYDAVVQRAVRESQIKLVVVNLDEERVIRWIT